MNRSFYLMMAIFVALITAEAGHSRGFGGFGGGGFRAGGYDGGSFHGAGRYVDGYRPAHRPIPVDVYGPNYVVVPTDDGYGYDDDPDDTNGD
jgi:hypothetical protein